MDLYLQTRGKFNDYQFLGKAPPGSFWDELSKYTSFEHGTLLVLGDGARFQVYRSGLDSARKDRVGTVIRYTVVAEGRIGDPLTLPLLHFLGLSLVEPAEAGRRLDQAFPEAEVESMIRSSGPLRPVQERELIGQGAARRIEDVLRGASPFQAQPSPSGSWLTLDTPEHRAALLGRIPDFLFGRKTGLAAILNLVGAPGELSPLLPRFGELAVLSDIEGTPAGFAPIVPSPALPETRPRLLPFVILGLGAGAGLYLLRRRMRSQ